MSFFPYEPPVSDDEPEDDDLLSGLHTELDRAALTSHRSDVDVLMPDASVAEQQLATFLDALFRGNTAASNEQIQQQYLAWCQRQFAAAAGRKKVSGALGITEEQHLTRLLSWLE